MKAQVSSWESIPISRIVDCRGMCISYFHSTAIDPAMGVIEGLRISSKEINSICAE